MPALFPAWSNLPYRLIAAALPLAVLSIPAALMVYVRSPWTTGQLEAVEQPVEFDHRHHVVDDRIDCLYCHRGSETSDFAGVPATEVCMGCHSQIWNESPLLALVRESYFADRPIPWNRVHDLGDFVYFNHAVHVRRGIGCVPCHGRVDQMARVYKVAPLTMKWCLDCHRDRARVLERLAHEGQPQTPSGTAWGRDARENAPRDRALTSLTTCTTCHR